MNHLGHFLLATLLAPKLDATAAASKDGARLVVLSAESHSLGRMHWERGFLNAEKDYEPWEAYFQSKLANVLFVREFDRLAAQRARSEITQQPAPKPASISAVAHVVLEKRLAFGVVNRSC